MLNLARKNLDVYMYMYLEFIRSSSGAPVSVDVFNV
jgi:hypothetical protein